MTATEHRQGPSHWHWQKLVTRGLPSRGQITRRCECGLLGVGAHWHVTSQCDCHCQVGLLRRAAFDKFQHSLNSAGSALVTVTGTAGRDDHGHIANATVTAIRRVTVIRCIKIAQTRESSLTPTTSAPLSGLEWSRRVTVTVPTVTVTVMVAVPVPP